MVATRKFMVARQLGGKRVVTNRGEEIGRLNDIVIDEKAGRFEFLVVEPNSDSKLAKNMTAKGGLIEIPYKAVFAVSDVIIVDESLLV